MSSIHSKADKYAFSASGSAYPGTPNLQFEMKNRSILTLKVVNLGRETYEPVALSGNDLTWKLQESVDGSAWTDVGGITSTVKPMGESNFTTPVNKYWRILAYGNTEAALMVMCDETLDLKLV